MMMIKMIKPYIAEIFGLDDDLFRSIERPKILVKEILLNPGSRSRRSPELDGIGCYIQPSNACGKSNSKSNTQDNDWQRISGKKCSQFSEEIGQGNLKVHAKFVNEPKFIFQFEFFHFRSYKMRWERSSRLTGTMIKK